MERNGTDEEGFGSDAELPEGVIREEKKKKKQKKDEDEDNQPFEEVPAGPNLSDYDSDDIAETRALAKLMLWKKNREDIIDASYNRYNFNDEGCDLPDWFVEDESRAYVPNIPVTKEMIAEEKKAMAEYNARSSKKEMEAKWRKRKKEVRLMKKIRKKANLIASQDDINEGAKFKEIKKLYAKERA